jgi:lipid-A-disaccharide synthase-like uncharacterized protein
MSIDPRWHWDLWVAFGLAGQLVFGTRFIVQWLASERKKKSHIPIGFWYLSLIGGLITTIYAIHRRDAVFIVGQGAGLVIYIRNLMLIHRHRADHAEPRTAEPAASDRA